MDEADVYPVALVVAGRPCLVVGGGTAAGQQAVDLARCGAAVTMVAPEIHEALAVLHAHGLDVGAIVDDRRSAHPGSAVHPGSAAETDDPVGAPDDVAIEAAHATRPGEPRLRPGTGTGGDRDAGGRAIATSSSMVKVLVRPYEPGEATEYRLVVAATGVPAVDDQVHRDADAAGVWVNCSDRTRCSLLLPTVHRAGRVTVAVTTPGASPALVAWVRSRVADTLGPGIGDLADLLDRARRALHREGRSTETIDWAGLLDGPLPDLVRAGRPAEASSLVSNAVGVELGI